MENIIKTRVKFTKREDYWGNIVLGGPIEKYLGWNIRVGRSFFTHIPDGYFPPFGAECGLFATKGCKIIPLGTESIEAAMSILEDELA